MTGDQAAPAEKWCENVILVDAEYIDKVAFDLIVNFERMLGRRIPQADMARWIDCIALDGGMRPQADAQTSVVFVHDKQHERLQNFLPDHFANDLHQKAFSDTLGEFMLSAFPVEEEVVSKCDFIVDIAQTVCRLPEVRRVMIVPNADTMYSHLRAALRNAADDKRITVFAMQPMPAGNFRQEILGYSLMSALGINSDEVERL